MQSRRDFLRAGTVAGAAAMVGMSGCVGDGILGGGSEEIDDWLIDPLRLPGDVVTYPVMSDATSAIESHSDEFRRASWNSYRDFYIERYDFTRLFPADVSRFIQANNGYPNGGYDVVIGGFEESEMEDDLENDGYGRRGEHEGFELFEKADDEMAAGLMDEYLIVAGDGGDRALETVEWVIDTKEGGRERTYAEIDSDFAAIYNELTYRDRFTADVEERPIEETNIEAGRFRNQRAVGVGVELDEGDSSFEIALLFDRDRDPNQRDIRQWTQSENFPPVPVDIEIEEEMAVISGEIDTPDILDVRFI